jgi:hypothetical protein
VNCSTTNIKLSLSDLDLRTPLNGLAPERSPGLHVSDLYRRIAVDSGILKSVGDDEEMNPLVLGVGMAWEEFCVTLAACENVIWQPGERVCDGVILSPDGWDFQANRLEEFKATWTSSASKSGGEKTIEEMWLYRVQMMAYCYAMGTVLARLHVLFINGNYRYEGVGPQPVYRVYEMEFTKRELKRNWEMLMREKERQVASGKNNG